VKSYNRGGLYWAEKSGLRRELRAAEIEGFMVMRCDNSRGIMVEDTVASQTPYLNRRVMKNELRSSNVHK